jgi:hypothetical protein
MQNTDTVTLAAIELLRHDRNPQRAIRALKKSRNAHAGEIQHELENHLSEVKKAVKTVIAEREEENKKKEEKAKKFKEEEEERIKAKEEKGELLALANSADSLEEAMDFLDDTLVSIQDTKWKKDYEKKLKSQANERARQLGKERSEAALKRKEQEQKEQERRAAEQAAWIEKYGNKKRVVYNDQPGGRMRRKKAFFVTAKGKLIGFDYEPPLGVEVVKQTWIKQGKWSHMEFHMAIPNGWGFIVFQEGFETGKYFEGINTPESLAEHISKKTGIFVTPEEAGKLL